MKEKQNLIGIEVDNFIIEPETQVPGRFNVYERTVSKTGKDVLRCDNWGVKLSRAVHIISEHNTWSDKKRMSLNQYLEKKGNEVDRIFKEIDTQSKALYNALRSKGTNAGSIISEK